MRPDHLTESEVAGFLDDDLSAGERRRVESHIEQCATCRAEVVGVMRAVAGAPAPRRQPAAAADGGPRPRSRLWPALAASALAAGVAVVMLLRPDEGIRSAPGMQRAVPGVADGARTVIAVSAPRDGAVVDGSRASFTWRPTPIPASLYRLTVLGDDGAPVWTTETPDTVARLPATVRLQPARQYFWVVDAIGAGITASTGTRSFHTK